MVESIASQQACLLSIEEIVSLLQSSLPSGLSEVEVSVRRDELGANELDSEPPEPMWKKFLEKIKEPMIALLLGSAVLSVLTGQIDDAVSITLAIVIVTIVGVVQEYKSDESIAALSKLAPPTCHVYRESVVRAILASELVVGDIIILNTGDRVPADVRLVECTNLLVEESSMTGEQEPVKKCVERIALSSYKPRSPSSSSSSNLIESTSVSISVGLSDRHNVCFMGSLVRGGHGRAIVIGTGMKTELGHIVELMGVTESAKSPLENSMADLAETLTKTSIAVIAVIAIIGIYRQNEFMKVVGIAVSLAVAAIPEGLPIVVAVTLALGVQRMASRNAVVKRLPAVEALGCASVICCDKTGTLTKNEMTVVEAFTFSGMGTRPFNDQSVGGTSGSFNEPIAVLRRFEDARAHEIPVDDAHAAIHNLLGIAVGSRLLFSGSSVHTSSLHPVSLQPLNFPNSPLPLASTHSLSSSSSLSSEPSVKPLLNASLALAMEAAVLCNNAACGPLDDISHLEGQPTEASLLPAAVKAGVSISSVKGAWRRLEEEPFSSESKYMRVECELLNPDRNRDGTNAGRTGFVKGSLERVLDHCQYVLLRVGEAAAYGLPEFAVPESIFVGLVDANVFTNDDAHMLMSQYRACPLRGAVLAVAVAAAETMSHEGLRVLAMARSLPSFYSPFSNSDYNISPHSSFNGLFLGLVGVHDPPRDGVLEAIRELQQRHVRVMMLTGDSRTTAIAIATQLGILPSPSKTRGISRTGDTPVYEMGSLMEVPDSVGRNLTVSGVEIDTLSDMELTLMCANALLFHRVSPRHKLRIVRALQAGGHIVAMTGDGVNDAPAMKQANIGVAMGHSGTDVAKEAAGVVLMDDWFGTLVGAVDEGKGIFMNIRNFVRFQLSTSVAALALVAICGAAGLPSPLNAMQILWINIIMDGPPAQSLGLEPVLPASLPRHPRAPKSPILSSGLLLRILLSAVAVCVGTFFAFYSSLKEENVEESSMVSARVHSIAFTTFVLFDMFNAMGCRSETRSLLLGMMDDIKVAFKSCARGSNGFELLPTSTGPLQTRNPNGISLFSNKPLLYSVTASIAAQIAVIQLPPLQAIFQTAGLTLAEWTQCIAISSSVLVLEEIIKLCIRLGYGARFTSTEPIGMSAVSNRFHSLARNFRSIPVVRKVLRQRNDVNSDE